MRSEEHEKTGRLAGLFCTSYDAVKIHGLTVEISFIIITGSKRKEESEK
jgi:hypothetical protein